MEAAIRITYLTRGMPLQRSGSFPLRNMSQEQVCEKRSGLLGNIENDKGNHRKSTLKKLTDFYDMDPEEFE